MRTVPILCLAMAVACTACADDDPARAARTDAGAFDGGVAELPIEEDAGALDVPACSEADFAASCASPNGGSCLDGGRLEVNFPTGGVPAQYENRCLRVRAGTQVAFRGRFAFHPLVARGGAEPSPIPRTATDPPPGDGGVPELVVTFATSGTYGYVCEYHPRAMTGAVDVLP